MIAGIFAFMPIDKASTVHTTIQTTIQNTQLNQIQSTFQTDMSTNASATCGSGSSFLVYFVFSNNTKVPTATAAVPGESTVLGIFDGVGNVAVGGEGIRHWKTEYDRILGCQQRLHCQQRGGTVAIQFVQPRIADGRKWLCQAVQKGARFVVEFVNLARPVFL